MLGGLCLSGCCGQIGYDGPKWNIHSTWFPDLTAVEQVGQDVSKLQGLSLLMAGNDFTCAAAMRFLPEAIWNDIRYWIFAGGRMYLQTEYGSEADPTAPGCLTDPDKVNSFLGFINSSIQWGGGVATSDGACDHLCTPNGGHPINNEVQLYIAATARLNGGTPLQTSPAGRICMVIEQLDQGFIMVGGDSNISGGCAHVAQNGKLFQNYYNNASNDLI